MDNKPLLDQLIEKKKEIYELEQEIEILKMQYTELEQKALEDFVDDHIDHKGYRFRKKRKYNFRTANKNFYKKYPEYTYTYTCSMVNHNSLKQAIENGEVFDDLVVSRGEGIEIKFLNNSQNRALRSF